VSIDGFSVRMIVVLMRVLLVFEEKELINIGRIFEIYGLFVRFCPADNIGGDWETVELKLI